MSEYNVIRHSCSSFKDKKLIDILNGCDMVFYDRGSCLASVCVCLMPAGCFPYAWKIPFIRDGFITIWTDFLIRYTTAVGLHGWFTMQEVCGDTICIVW